MILFFDIFVLNFLLRKFLKAAISRNLVCFERSLIFTEIANSLTEKVRQFLTGESFFKLS